MLFYILGQSADKLYYLLGKIIAWGGFRTENERFGAHFFIRVFKQLVIKRNYIKRVHNLPFIFVHTLCLYVEHGIRVDYHALLLLRVIAKLQLFNVLYFVNSIENGFVAAEFLKFRKARSVKHEAVAYTIGNKP